MVAVPLILNAVTVGAVVSTGEAFLVAVQTPLGSPPLRPLHTQETYQSICGNAGFDGFDSPDAQKARLPYPVSVEE